MNSTKPSISKSTIRQALEDFIVVGGLATLGMLVAQGTGGGLPTIEMLYGAGIAGALGGLVAYARARQIQKAG